jgi:hypothetical protein
MYSDHRALTADDNTCHPRLQAVKLYAHKSKRSLIFGMSPRRVQQLEPFPLPRHGDVYQANATITEGMLTLHISLHEKIINFKVEIGIARTICAAGILPL